MSSVISSTAPKGSAQTGLFSERRQWNLLPLSGFCLTFTFRKTVQTEPINWTCWPHKRKLQFTMPGGIIETQDELGYTWGNKQVFACKSARVDTESNNNNRQWLSLDFIISGCTAAATTPATVLLQGLFTFWFDPQYPGPELVFICCECTQYWALRCRMSQW